MKAIKIASLFALTAVSAAVSSTTYASGVDLIKSDDITINFNGDLDLKAIHSSNATSSSPTEIEANFDDIDFEFTWKIDDSLSFTAGSDWSVESDENNDIVNKQSWVGLKSGAFYARAGLQEDAIDPLGIDSFEISSMGRASGDQDGSGTTFAETLLFGYAKGNNKVLFSHSIATEASGSGDSEEGEVPGRFALYGKTKIDNFQFEAGIGTEENHDETTEVDFMQAQAEYFDGPMTYGVLVSRMDVEQAASTDTDYGSTGFELNVKYKANSKLSLYAGYETIDNGIADTDDYKHTAIGASYAFSKLVKLYVEAGREDGTYIRGDVTGSGPRTVTKDEEEIIGAFLSVDF